MDIFSALCFGARQFISCCALFCFLRFSAHIQKTRFRSGAAQNNALEHAATSNRFSATQLLIFAHHRPAIVQFSTKFLPKHPPNGLPRMIRRF